MKRRLLAVLAIVVVVAGCNPANPSSSTPTQAAPTSVASPTTMPTLTAIPTLTKIPTPENTATPELSASPQVFVPSVALWIDDERPFWIGYVNADAAFTLVEPDGKGSTTTAHLHITYSNYHFPPQRSTDQLLATYTTDAGQIGTIVFQAGNQNQFNALLAEWQQELSTQAAAAAAEAITQAATATALAPCAIGVTDHDATIIFAGGESHAWCSEIAADRLQIRKVATASNMNTVCTVAVTGATATVRDTGGYTYGQSLCGQLQTLGGLPPSGWQLAGGMLSDASAMNQIIQQIPTLIGRTQGYVAQESGAIQTMQQALQKEQKDAAVRPMPDYWANGVVASEYSGVLESTYTGVLEAGRSNLADTLNQLKSALSDGDKHLAAAQQEIASAKKLAPGPFTSVQTVIQQYQAASADAKKQMASIQASDAKAESNAQAMLTQGKQIVASAQAAVQH